MMDIAQEAFPELTFVGFIGDLDYLIGKINNSTTLTTSPIIHSASSGMLCELALTSAELIFTHITISLISGILKFNLD